MKPETKLEFLIALLFHLDLLSTTTQPRKQIIYKRLSTKVRLSPLDETCFQKFKKLNHAKIQMPNNQAHLESLLLKSEINLTYRSEIIHMDFQNIGVDTFCAENIRNCEEYVLSIQRRLDKVVADNDKKGIRELFDLLTKRSNAVKILATYRITTRNAGKYTAGIDGIAIPKSESRQTQNQIRHKIMTEIDIDKKTRFNPQGIHSKAKWR